MNVKSHRSLLKVIHHAEKILSYSTSTVEWWNDDKSLEAIVFNLAQIGEWVKFVEDSVQNKYEQVNWAAMRGLRNRIIHDYDYINPLVIRGIIDKDLPKLVLDLQHILISESISEA